MRARWEIGHRARQRLNAARHVAEVRLAKNALTGLRESDAVEEAEDAAQEALLEEAADIAEILCLDLMSRIRVSEELDEEARRACEEAFRIQRWMTPPVEWDNQLKHILRVACLGILAERTADTKNWLRELGEFPGPPSGENWADRVFAHVVTSFLRDMRQNGWDDLDKVGDNIRSLREAQTEYEQEYLTEFGNSAPRAAAELVALYHWAKAAELVSQFLSQGSPMDVESQLEFHFNRSREAVAAGWIGELGTLVFLTERVASAIIARSVWRTIRPYGDRFVEFLDQVVNRENLEPIFELLPPQKKALEMRLMDVAQRAVVIEMPTSSGKTLLAEFRIIQAKQSFAEAMIVYLVPTRALVNQVTVRLRQELGPLGFTIEQAAPAFELDPSEEEFLLSPQAFDVLVTTPEKMDLLTRSGHLIQTNRPLGLVVVDEAHNIGSDARGLRTEILLSTISREFPDVRFLLLSPFVPNVDELGRWLGDGSNVSLSIRWEPNDKLIGLCYPRGRGRDWDIHIRSLFTPAPRRNVDLDEPARLTSSPVSSLINKPRSQLSKRDIAVATSSILSSRGNVLVMTAGRAEAHRVAQEIDALMSSGDEPSGELELVRRFVSAELGEEYLLTQLLGNRIAFHHAGLSPEARFLVEWLMAKGHLNVLVATSTLAQGVNFPVASVVLTSHTQHGGTGEGRRAMPIDQFWNIAGRTGRLHQDSLGLALFASRNELDNDILQDYVEQQVQDLASYLEEMVNEVLRVGGDLSLETLVQYPAWSTFSQYIAHAYRVAERPTDFVARSESLLLSTLGYRRLQDTSPHIAQMLLQATRSYANQLQNVNSGVLTLMDRTGFSPRTVQMLFDRSGAIRRNLDEWSPSGLFSSQSQALNALVGVLLQVDELNIDTDSGRFGSNIGQIVTAWVRGQRVTDIAHQFFGDDDPTKSVTDCCQKLFGNILPNATWGLGALQSVGIEENHLNSLSRAQQLEVRSIPAMVLYGVDTLDGVIMRNLNVPRLIAKAMGERFGREVTSLEGRMSHAKNWLGAQPVETWQQAVPTGSGLDGSGYKRVWEILNGFDSTN